MTQEQIFNFNLMIEGFAGSDLNTLQSLLEQKIQDDYNKKENFLLHERIDDFIYIVYYDNGDSHYFCKGKEAYEDYIKFGIRIERKTKDLFPKFETLLEKNYEQKETSLRH